MLVMAKWPPRSVTVVRPAFTNTTFAPGRGAPVLPSVTLPETVPVTAGQAPAAASSSRPPTNNVTRLAFIAFTSLSFQLELDPGVSVNAPGNAILNRRAVAPFLHPGNRRPIQACGAGGIEHGHVADDSILEHLDSELHHSLQPGLGRGLRVGELPLPDHFRLLAVGESRGEARPSSTDAFAGALP